MKFHPIETAPEGKGRGEQILCRFPAAFPYLGQWVYFVAWANGAKTEAPGFAAPTEWCKLNIYMIEKE